MGLSNSERINQLLKAAPLSILFTRNGSCRKLNFCAYANRYVALRACPSISAAMVHGMVGVIMHDGVDWKAAPELLNGGDWTPTEKRIGSNHPTSLRHVILVHGYEPAPLFGYEGDLRESLTKTWLAEVRPDGEKPRLANTTADPYGTTLQSDAYRKSLFCDEYSNTHHS